jgi:hypothetical protein
VALRERVSSEPLRATRELDWGRCLSEPALVTVRVYVVRADRLKAKDDNNLSDPFLRVTLDAAVRRSESLFTSSAAHEPPWVFKENMSGVWPSGTKKSGKEVDQKIIESTLNPYFGQVFEFRRVVLPGPCRLSVSVLDHDMISSDDMIGTTRIDLEDRYCSKEWRDFGVGAGSKAVLKPLERRDLFTDLGPKITQGTVDMWVEMFKPAEEHRYPLQNLTPPKKQLFELRVIVWQAQDMQPADYIGDMNDLYFTGHLLTRDDQNRPQEHTQETDIHWRAKDGGGSFNYR